MVWLVICCFVLLFFIAKCLLLLMHIVIFYVTMRLDYLFKNQNNYTMFPKFLGSYIYIDFSTLFKSLVLCCQRTVALFLGEIPHFLFKSIIVISNPFKGNVMFFLLCSCSQTIVMFFLLLFQLCYVFIPLLSFIALSICLLFTPVFCHCNSGYPSIRYTAVSC